MALADDNFYPVALADLAMAERQHNEKRLEQLRALRNERFELMARLAELPPDMVFFTQITMEAAEDTAFLDAAEAGQRTYANPRNFAAGSVVWPGAVGAKVRNAKKHAADVRSVRCFFMV